MDSLVAYLPHVHAQATANSRTEFKVEAVLRTGMKALPGIRRRETWSN